MLVVNKAGCLGEIDICNKVPFSFHSDVVIGHFLIALEGTILLNETIHKAFTIKQITSVLLAFTPCTKKGAKTKSYVHNTQQKK